jgi:hypothetical protein
VLRELWRQGRPLRPLAALVGAWILLVQGTTGWNQLSHYVLVEALSHGHTVIDPYHAQTADVSWFHGHYFADKAPGLALFVLPLYEVAHALGLQSALGANATVGMVWLLGLLGVVAPAATLLVLVRRTVERLRPGFGTATATLLGTGTLLLPFATIFFAHALSACLGFGAFVLAGEARSAGRQLLLLVAAGILAGYAVAVEYPLALVGALVGIYACLPRDILRRASAYGLGVAVGVAPLIAYNVAAFGAPFHLSYVGAIIRAGRTGHEVVGLHKEGFFGITAPSLRTLMDLLVSHIGLFTLAPVLLLVLPGLALLFRRWRAEALLVGALIVASLTWNAGFYSPFGGSSPGPRYLVPLLPFLMLPLALALERWPLTGVVLGTISVVAMVSVTMTSPVLAGDGHWGDRLRDGQLVHTVVGVIGLGHGWGQMVPFLLLFGLACWLGARSLPHLPLRWAEAPLVCLALLSWLALRIVEPRLDGRGLAGAAATAFLGVLLTAGWCWLAFRGDRESLDAAPVPRGARLSSR